LYRTLVLKIFKISKTTFVVTKKCSKFR
jgi:hypothetical protein